MLAIPYLGHRYEILPALDWPPEAIEHLNADDYVAFVRLVLGPEQYEAFRSRGAHSGDVVAIALVITGVARGIEPAAMPRRARRAAARIVRTAL